MMVTRPIETARLILRTLEEKDATAQYAGWLNDPAVNRYLETRHATTNDVARYIREKQKSPVALLFGIFVKQTNEHIGNVKLEPIGDGAATMGILIGEISWWGKGIATEVTHAVCDYAHKELGVSEINLGVIAENKAAIRVYEKCGFTISHAHREVLTHEGKKFNQLWMRKKYD